MKTKNLLIAMLFVFAMAQMSFGQIVGTAHDFQDAAGFNLDAWNTAVTNRICGPCHTPHNAILPANAPLWSHLETVAAHTPYPGSPAGTMDAIVNAPSGISLVCLSCHDGTVALDNFIPVNGVTTPLVGSAMLGIDLSNDHPISFTYNDALATLDGELFFPLTDLTEIGGTIENDYLFGTSGSMTLECASCHDPHGTGNPVLMRTLNTASELCLDCHNK